MRARAQAAFALPAARIGRGGSPDARSNRRAGAQRRKNHMEIGVMFWAGRDDLAEIRSMVDCGQLGIGGEIELTPQFAAEWKASLHNFSLATVVCAYRGESYADIPTVQATVGFIPHSTRAERERRTLEVSDFAAQLAAPGLGCHI